MGTFYSTIRLFGAAAIFICFVWLLNQQAISSDEDFTFRSFPVKAATVDELKAKLLSGAGPKDPHGVHRYAVTEWNIQWRWPVKDGQARLKDAVVTCEVIITMPEWVRTNPDTPIDEVQRWERLYDALLRHELDHARQAKQTARLIKNELASLVLQGQTDPYLANRAAQKLLAKNREWDREYDRNTNHGKAQGIE